MTSILLALCPAFAQSPWKPVTPGGVYRDAVSDPAADGILLADHAGDVVRRVNPDTGESTGEFPVGDGPSSIAVIVRNGAPLLACVNNLDRTLSLLDASGETLQITAIGGTPLDAEAVPGGGFLVTDAGLNRVLLLPASGGPDGASVRTLAPNAGTPAAAAASPRWVAWIGREAPEVSLLRMDTAGGGRMRVALPEAPVALCALEGPGDRFAAATAPGIYLFEGGAEGILAHKALPVTDMAADGAGLVVLSGDDVVMLDKDLNETGRVAVEIPARLVRACGSVLVAMAPQERKAVVWNRTAKAPVETPEESPAGPASESRVQVVEAEPVAPPETTEPESEPVTAPLPAAQETSREAVSEAPVAPPVPETDFPAGEEAASAAPETAVPAADATPPAESAGATEPAPETETEKPRGRYRSMPMFTGSLRAPGLNTATHKLIGGVERQGLRDALTRPIEFGEPGLGFTPPDWTEPLRDLEADTMTTDLSTGRTVMRDNVRLRLGEMAFRSDQFSYSDEQGSYDAEGHVVVSQRQSTLSADYLSYATPEAEVVERAFVLEPRDEQNMAKKRLSMGRITGRNLHVSEPTRELMAEEIDYDFAAQKGTLVNARGRAAYFYYSAEKLHILGPEEFIAENAWFTTCPGDPPGYRLMVKELHVEKGEAVAGKGSRLALGNFKAPFLLPIWGSTAGPYPWSVDFDSGRYAETGYYLNLGQQFQVSRELSLGPRIMPTEKEGVGLGGDIYYDYMEKPSSRLYRTSGEFHGLQTTENRGYLAWYNRFEPNRDVVLRMQAEQWSDEQFYKDFFYEQYRHRSDPRTFANLTLRKEDFIATGTARINTHSWVGETERLPEATFHLVERPLTDRLMFSFDTVNGYNDWNPGREYGVRSVNIARMSYDWDPASWLSVTPFYELEGSFYQRGRITEDSASRVSNTTGVTLQTRLHREFPGFWGFSAFKHVLLPSVTYSYRPEPTFAADDAPRFDALDNVYGRSRLETKLTNVVYGRDAETNDVWQAARLTLYQGNDFWNDTRKADDYEAELDLRPRPWWGMQLAGERHNTRRPESLLEENFLENRFYKAYERATGKVLNERAADLNLRYADYSRILTQLYYDNTVVGGRFNTRVGFAYSDTDGNIYNRDVLYGLGYRLSENWGVSFEHIYDLNEDEMRSQTYEIRRSFKCWETALRFRDRQSGFDVNMEISLTAFPDTAIGF